MYETARIGEMEIKGIKKEAALRLPLHNRIS